MFRYLEHFKRNFYPFKKSYFSLCFTMITENRLLWGSALLYDVIVTSYVGCLNLFWFLWKEETHSYTMVPKQPVSVGSLFKVMGVVTVPLGKLCYKKKKKKKDW